MLSRNIKIKAHSQSINKVVSRFEGEFDLEAEGSKPTERLESIIEKIKNKHSDINNEINELLLEAYSIGTRSGFERALCRLQDGKIYSRKIRNKDEWELFSNSKKYQITEKLPSASEKYIKATVYLYLADSGFE